jgi:hypothetical protein
MSRPVPPGPLAATLVVVALIGAVAAQPAVPPLRLALLSQWVVIHHSPASPEFAAALDAGVVDGPVFAWQGGRIPRSAFVEKPIRVLPPPEASQLGGRGEFQITAIRPPAGPTAWTEVEVAPRTGLPGDELVLEIGGELNTVNQVLARLFVRGPDGRLEELPLARRAVLSRPGVPVIAAPFGHPVAATEAASFRGIHGVEFLVVRSPIETIVDGSVTPSGPADVSPFQGGEWREADRVYVRMPLATLRAGAAPTVLVWKDRVYRSDPDRRRPFDP